MLVQLTVAISVAAHALSPCGHTMCGACAFEWTREQVRVIWPALCALTIRPPMLVYLPNLPQDALYADIVSPDPTTFDGLAHRAVGGGSRIAMGGPARLQGSCRVGKRFATLKHLIR